MRSLLILVTLAVLTSCNNSENHIKPTVGKSDNKSNDTTNRDKDIQQTDAYSCYIKILQRDSFAIKLKQTKNSVTGKMTFDNYQKDGSTGTVNGIIEDNIIKLWYNFASEGMNSVMEIYFKKEGTRLVRGIGPVDVKGDTSYYTDHSAIQYPKEEAFNKIPCEELAEKYK